MKITKKTPEQTVSKMGPPTKCTPDNIEKICNLIRQGCYPSIATSSVGVNPQMFFQWTKKGINGEEPYKTFYEATQVAYAEAENALVQTIKNAAKTNWLPAAWLLERTHKDRYALTTKSEVSGPDGGPVEIVAIQQSILSKLSRIAADSNTIEVCPEPKS